MTTTLIFVELLINGIQASIWLFVLVLTVFGTNWLTHLDLSVLKDWQTILTIVGLSFVYVLGIIFDRIADSIFMLWDINFARKKYPDIASFAVLRFEVAKDNPDLRAQFEYNRSRMRLARSTAFNFAITTFILVVFCLLRLPTELESRFTIIVFIAVIGAALTSVSIYAWHQLITGHLKFIKNYKDMSTSSTSEKVLKRVKK